MGTKALNLFYKGDVPVITIDGTSSAGKGVISRLLAERLQWHFLDSGAIYRVLALVAMRNKIPIDDIPLLVAAAKDLNIHFISQPELPPKVILTDEDVTSIIRQEEYGNVASRISSFQEVRSILIAKQRSFCNFPGLVADGRDMGTVVFPNARLKFFLTASAEERAKRRLLQLQDQGINATLSTILADLTARDQRDCKRVVSPLKPDPAAMIIDTTKLSIDEVLQKILAHVKSMQV